MKLADIIETFISGDWGEETVAEDTPNSVFCIRGADIVPITNHSFDGIPQRFVCDKTKETKTLKAGDLIIEKSGGSPTQSTGRIVYVSDDLIKSKGDVVCSNFCTAFRVKSEWNPLYVYFYWQNIYNHGAFFNFEGKTSGIKNLQLDNALSAIEIEYLPLEEQNRIASVLSSIDDKMKVNRRINDNLEDQLCLITSLKIFKSPNLVYKNIGDIANIKAGGDCPNVFSKELTKNCTVPIYSNGTENRGLYGYTNNAVISERCITVAARGTIGYCERRLHPFVPIIRLLSLVPKDKGADVYLQQVINGITFKKNGSVQQQLTVPEISYIKVPYPSKEVLNEYNSIVTPIIEKIEQNIKQNETLTKQRDELLPLLMNGQAMVL